MRVLAIIFLALAAGSSLAPAASTPDEALVFDPAAAQDFLEDILPTDIEGISQDDWNSFWANIEAVLSAKSVEGLAEYRGDAETALNYLEATPGGQAYADWLRQRLDYLELAETATREAPAVPTPTPTKKPTPPPKKPQAFPHTAAKPPPPRTTVSRTVEEKRLGTVRSEMRWVQKLARRPPPANAGELIPLLKSEFKKAGVPPELVWIAEVESTLNPKARSPTGAVGLFQLMPTTAQRFGLNTGFFDERKHPEKSAAAAALYLRALYRQLNSWPLVFAAYNAGEGRVGGLLRGQKERTFEAIADRLSLETQMYVPKVLAVIELREKVDATKLPAPQAALNTSREFAMHVEALLLQKDCR